MEINLVASVFGKNSRSLLRRSEAWQRSVWAKYATVERWGLEGGSEQVGEVFVAGWLVVAELQRTVLPGTF